MGTTPTSDRNLKERLTVISYNLHGLNQGSPGISELVSSLFPDVIMIQEHWLTPDNMFKLNDLSRDYFVCGSSAMMQCVTAGPLYGRPFGGVAILIKNKFASCTVNVMNCDRLSIVKIANYLVINVYMPCTGTVDRLTLYCDLLSELQAVIDSNSNCDCIIGGDFNTDLDCSGAATDPVNQFITSNRLMRCDLLFPVADNATYVNESLNLKSKIDYFLISEPKLVVAYNVLDINLNLSDHLPIMAVCLYDNAPRDSLSSPGDDVSYFRWDHAPLDLYYEQTRLFLQPIFEKLCHCLEDASADAERIAAVDELYNRTVAALQECANLVIPKHKKGFYKFWWSQELDELKDKATASCRLWKDAGKPRHGSIQTKYKQDKLLYKKRIREARAEETNSISNDLHDALNHKTGKDFWRIWNSKFPNKTNVVNQVGGAIDSTVILQKFAEHFTQTCTPFSTSRNNELKAIYVQRRSNYCGSAILENDFFDVELISSIISNMKNGKAAGLDGLTAEHLKFSHPVVVIILCKLFNFYLSVSHIPASFGLSYTVPIPKCDALSKSLTVDDFRGISISPVISKLFELAILDRFDDYFETSDCQFGFKKKLSCRHAIFSVRNVIEHYVSCGSTVNVCALDLSKAFDKMNHFVLFNKLMDRKLPVNILHILEVWFSSSETCVRWGGQFSYFFKLSVGIRQGGVLSPLLFAVFIDGLVSRIKATGVGCYLSNVCVSIYLYADDILLVSPTVSGLQALVNTCDSEFFDIDMRINAKKSICIRFGSRFSERCGNITSAQGGTLAWVETCRYLGVYFTSGRLFRCSFSEGKRSFFRAFNSIFGKVGRASEEVVLSLIRAKCLPILLYGVEACPALARDKSSFNFSFTRLLMKLFCTGSPDVVKECQIYFKLLPLNFEIDLRTASFLAQFMLSDNEMCVILARQAQSMLNSIFNCYGSAITSVQELRAAINVKFFGS